MCLCYRSVRYETRIVSGSAICIVKASYVCHISVQFTVRECFVQFKVWVSFEIESIYENQKWLYHRVYSIELVLACLLISKFSLLASLASWVAHSDMINSIEFVHRNDRMLVITASSDCSVCLWDVYGNKIGVFGQEEHWKIEPVPIGNAESELEEGVSDIFWCLIAC